MKDDLTPLTPEQLRAIGRENLKKLLDEIRKKVFKPDSRKKEQPNG